MIRQPMEGTPKYKELDPRHDYPMKLFVPLQLL